MIELHKLENYLAELLNTLTFNDYCINGLQIEGREVIEKIVTGVSASSRLFRAVLERKADAVILHHGLFWKNSPHPMVLRGILKERVKLLLDAEVNLFGYHLPLDAHPEFGNSALIASVLGLTDISFIPSAGIENPIAACGKLPNPVSFQNFKDHADEVMNTNGLGFDFHKTGIQRVFVLSGGGGNYYQDAADAGADIMVTGELNENNIRAAEELNLSLYAAGHYNSEKWGIRALGEHLADGFGLDVEFVDVPNPV